MRLVQRQETLEGVGGAGLVLQLVLGDLPQAEEDVDPLVDVGGHLLQLVEHPHQPVAAAGLSVEPGQAGERGMRQGRVLLPGLLQDVDGLGRSGEPLLVELAQLEEHRRGLLGLGDAG